MVRHTVMWRLHDQAQGADKAANLAETKDALLSCAQVVPDIRTFEVATATPGMDCTQDLVLHTQFDDAQVLAACQKHPQHLSTKPCMNAVV